MDRPAGSDALFIHTSEIDENSFERRKSSVLFNPELDYKESGESLFVQITHQDFYLFLLGSGLFPSKLWHSSSNEQREFEYLNMI